MTLYKNIAYSLWSVWLIVVEIRLLSKSGEVITLLRRLDMLPRDAVRASGRP